MRILVVAMSLIFFSYEAYASCQSIVEQTNKSCDPKLLKALTQNLSASSAVISSNMKDAGATGSKADPAETAKSSIADVQQTKQGLQSFEQKCQQIRAKCQQTCEQERAQKLAKQPFPDTQGAMQAGKNAKYCKEGKPKKVCEECKKAQGDSSKMLSALAQLLKALTGEDAEEEKEEEGEYCSTAHPDDPKCKTDTATISDTGAYKNGDYRSLEGGAFEGEEGLTPASGIAPGEAAEQQYSQSNSGGAGGGAGSGFGSLGSSSSGGAGDDRGRTGNAESENLLDKYGGGSYGGGGGSAANGFGGGGSGSDSEDSGGGAITTSSLDSADKSQLARMEKNFNEKRGFASTGPQGGIQAPHSLDNFKKMELRVDRERNSLDEL